MAYWILKKGSEAAAIWLNTETKGELFSTI
jgi:hypothetical protein